MFLVIYQIILFCSDSSSHNNNRALSYLIHIKSNKANIMLLFVIPFFKGESDNIPQTRNTCDV